MTRLPSVPTTLRTILLGAVLAGAAGAVDGDVRLVPQATVGTSGFEPGMAMEWRTGGHPDLIARPEVLLNEDWRLGAGFAVLADISPAMELPARHAVAVGPRVVYHNAHDHGWEGDIMATWSYDLGRGVRGWHHSVGVLGALGLVDDRHYDERRSGDREHGEVELGATIGVFYAIRL